MDETADKQRGCLGRGVRVAGAVLLLLLLAIATVAINKRHFNFPAMPSANFLRCHCEPRWPTRCSSAQLHSWSLRSAGQRQ